MKARVFITLKPGVLDPQGKAIHHALEGLGFSGVNDVRAGKLIELDLADGTRIPTSRTCAASCSPTRSSRISGSSACEDA